MKKQTLIVDPEFEALIPPLSKEEFKQLQDNIIEAAEVHDPIITWNGIILDGHHRWKVIQENPDILYKTKELSFLNRYDAKAWMIRNQLGRRNLSAEQQSYLRGVQYETEKLAQGGDRKSDAFSKSQNDTLISADTAARLAAEHGVTRATIHRDAQFARGVNALEEVAPGIKEKILSGKAKNVVNRTQIQAAPSKSEAEKADMAATIMGDQPVILEATKNIQQEKCKLCKRIAKHIDTQTTDGLIAEIQDTAMLVNNQMWCNVAYNPGLYAAQTDKQRVREELERVRDTMTALLNGLILRMK